MGFWMFILCCIVYNKKIMKLVLVKMGIYIKFFCYVLDVWSLKN